MRGVPEASRIGRSRPEPLGPGDAGDSWQAEGCLSGSALSWGFIGILRVGGSLRATEQLDREAELQQAQAATAGAKAWRNRPEPGDFLAARVLNDSEGEALARLDPPIEWKGQLWPSDLFS
jgi:hypothetical protein